MIDGLPVQTDGAHLSGLDPGLLEQEPQHRGVVFPQGDVEAGGPAEPGPRPHNPGQTFAESIGEGFVMVGQQPPLRAQNRTLQPEQDGVHPVQGGARHASGQDPGPGGAQGVSPPGPRSSTTRPTGIPLRRTVIS